MIYTLIADGPSDVVLQPILKWSLLRRGISPIESQWADLRRIPRQPDIESRIRAVLDLYPCDVLFIHRDSEGQSANLRREEIAAAVRSTGMFHIPVVPIRMTEAWLLAFERAIRCAAGNPNGRAELNLPDLRRLEDLPDPKTILYQALLEASELNARRRTTFPVRQRIHLIPNYIDDYSALNGLSAFATLQRDIELIADRFMQ